MKWSVENNCSDQSYHTIFINIGRKWSVTLLLAIDKASQTICPSDEFFVLVDKWKIENPRVKSHFKEAEPLPIPGIICFIPANLSLNWFMLCLMLSHRGPRSIATDGSIATTDRQYSNFETCRRQTWNTIILNNDSMTSLRFYRLFGVNNRFTIVFSSDRIKHSWICKFGRMITFLNLNTIWKMERLAIGMFASSFT